MHGLALLGLQVQDRQLGAFWRKNLGLFCIFQQWDITFQVLVLENVAPTAWAEVNLCSLRKKSTENLLQKIKANTESSGNIACILPCFHWKEEKRNYFSIWCFSIYLFLPTWSHHGPFPNLKVLRGGEMTVSKIMIGHRLKCGSKRVYIKWTFKCHGSSRISCFMLVDWFVSGWLNQTIVRHVCIIYVVHCIILWHVWWFDWWGA